MTSNPPLSRAGGSTLREDPEIEIARLRRQLDRERTRRMAAETIGEEATARLFDALEELRTTQAEILERAEQERILHELGRQLRQTLDTGRLMRLAARQLAEATSADRCLVLFTESGPDGTTEGDYTAPGAPLPAGPDLAQLPPGVRRLLELATVQRSVLRVEDVASDDRFDSADREAIITGMGVRALLGASMWVGAHGVGWVLLQSAEPREWRVRDVAILEGHAGELGTALLQVEAYEQQRESMRRLRELDRAKDAFVSTVSHELRTPLTSITGYVEMMLDGGMGTSDPGLAQGLQVISRNADRLRALVEDLLTLSAYDGAAVRLHVTDVELNEVVSDCHQALISLLVGRHLHLVFELDSGLGTIRADRGQIERVVMNVLTNAIKFTPDGGGIVVLSEAAGDEVSLTVTDTGIGIPEAEQGNLFSRFFRSSISVRDEIQGTGLGLALTKAIVDNHGGSVEISSEEGRGTTVRLRFPRSTPPPD